MNNTVSKVFTVGLLWLSSLAVILTAPIFQFHPGNSPSELLWNLSSTVFLRLGFYFTLIQLANIVVKIQDKHQNSLYHRTAHLIYFGSVVLVIGLIDPTMEMVRPHVMGLWMPLLVLFPIFFSVFIAPLFVMHVCEFLFMKNIDLINKSKSDIQAPAGAMVVLGYITLLAALIGEVFVESFRVELILIAAFSSIAVIIGFIQFAKVDCATKTVLQLRDMVVAKPISQISHSLMFAGIVALGTSVIVYFNTSFPDLPWIVTMGAVLHLAATIIISNLLACSIIENHLHRLDLEHSQTRKDASGAH